MLDEIQCGYGRTGHLWAFEGYDIIPDVLILGKGMGGGMPIAAFVTAREKMEVLSRKPVLGHITTFGGHPVCSAAALATLTSLMESDLIAKVKAKSELFYELLSSHPAIREIRRAGLMIALDLGDDEMVQQTIHYALEEGVVTDWFLFNTRSIRISPPLMITEDEIREGCSRLLKALNRIKISE